MVLRSDQKPEEQVEWRNPEAALALDLSLVEDVFRRLARQRREANSLKTGRDRHTHSSNNDNQISHTNASPIQTQVKLPRDGDGGDELQQHPAAPAAPTDGSSYFHPEMLFSKSDVLVTLEKSQGFLQKRPMLRMLHTSLACVSLEKEGASVEDFVRFQVKERTLSFAMARDRLLKIFSRTQSAKDFEAQVQLFKEQARTKSLWCVRDWKSRCAKPSQYYGVHVIPVKPKTQKQLDEEHKVLETVAAGVVNNALQLCMKKIVDQMIAARRPMSGGGKRSGRGRTPHSASQEDTENGSLSRSSSRIGGGASKLVLRARAKRGQEEMEARRKQLRLQILAPNVEQTSLLLVKAGPSASSESRKLQQQQQQQQSQLDDNNDGDELAGQEDGILPSGLEDPSDVPVKNRKSQSRFKQLLLFLATVEVNGDLRIAERLLTQKIAKSGFQRALDQAKNLGLAADDHWGLLKIWKTVYRNHTMQSLQSLLAK